MGKITTKRPTNIIGIEEAQIPSEAWTLPLKPIKPMFLKKLN